MTKYYEKALARVREGLKTAYPKLELQAEFEVHEFAGPQIVVTGKNVPVGVYRILESALKDSRHPYVDFGWGEECDAVCCRTGAGLTKPDRYVRCAEAQIEIEESQISVFAELEKTRKMLLKRLREMFPCSVKMERNAYQRKLYVCTSIKKSSSPDSAPLDFDALIRKVHAIVGDCLYGDERNTFDLSSSIYDTQGKIVVESVVKLCGRGPFSNQLFIALEREREAYRAIGKISN